MPHGVIRLPRNSKEQAVKTTLYFQVEGMSPEDKLKRIGEPFFTTKDKGTGLGIKLSTEIIELHDGSIKYASKENEGTTVKIRLKKIEN